MEEITKKKLNVLLESSKINQSIYDNLFYIDEYLQKYLNKPVNDERMLIHLAIAFKRVEENELIDNLPDDLWFEVKENKLYFEALKLWDKVKKKFDFDFPQEEERYVLMHLINLMGSEKND